MSNNYTDILIRIRPWNETTGAYPVEATLDDGSRFRDGELRLDMPALLKAEFDPEAYGRRLFDALFAGPIRSAYDKVTGRAEAEAGGRLRVRLWIDEGAAEVHALPWERLYHRHKGQWVLPGHIDADALLALHGPGDARAGSHHRAAGAPAHRHLQPARSAPGPAPIKVEREVGNLRQAPGNLRETGLIQVALLPGRTGLPAETLQRIEKGNGLGDSQCPLHSASVVVFCDEVQLRIEQETTLCQTPSLTP